LLWNDAPAVQSVLEKINQAVPLGARGSSTSRPDLRRHPRVDWRSPSRARPYTRRPC
jgi:hypothetical protein